MSPLMKFLCNAAPTDDYPCGHFELLLHLACTTLKVRQSFPILSIPTFLQLCSRPTAVNWAYIRTSCCYLEIPNKIPKDAPRGNRNRTQTIYQKQTQLQVLQELSRGRAIRQMKLAAHYKAWQVSIEENVQETNSLLSQII